MTDAYEIERENFVKMMTPYVGAAQAIQPLPNPNGLMRLPAKALRRGNGNSAENFARQMWDNRQEPIHRDNARQEYYACLLQTGGNDAQCRPLLDRLIKPDNKMPEELDEAFYVISPIVLDLDGDGIETISIENGIYVDPNEDGIFSKQGWISSDDGFLVIDLDGSGLITGREYFGETFLLDLIDIDGNQLEAKTGFTALHSFDHNHDFVIDHNDTV
ncbi:MAG TPA: hypothetical protein VGE32_17690, partial [Cellvibrio sp.]